MTRRCVVLGLFALLALGQIGVPVAMIVQRERVISHGRPFKFRTAPVDPFDALRGRYVALYFEVDFVPEVEGVKFVRGRRVYALIEEDAEGFARLTRLVEDRPEGDAYMRVEVGYTYDGKVHVDLPFDRYYLEEDIAPEAEKAYWEHRREGKRDAYVIVRVWRGDAALEELYVGGKPILEFLADQNRAGRGGRTERPQ